MRRPRRNHSAAFKAKVAVAAVRGDQTLALAQRFDVHPTRFAMEDRVAATRRGSLRYRGREARARPHGLAIDVWRKASLRDDP